MFGLRFEAEVAGLEDSNLEFFLHRISMEHYFQGDGVICKYGTVGTPYSPDKILFRPLNYSKGQLVFNSRFFRPNLGLIGNPRSVLESAHQDNSKTPPGSQN